MSYDWKEILRWFSEDPSKIKEPTEIIYAEYDCDGYEGRADVLFYDNNKFYYVSGSHCSCYGLEGQWDPEPYTTEILRGQVEAANYGFFKDQKELILVAIKRYSSELAILANEYASVEAEYRVVHARYKADQDRLNELDDRAKELADLMRQLLN